MFRRRYSQAGRIGIGCAMGMLLALGAIGCRWGEPYSKCETRKEGGILLLRHEIGGPDPMSYCAIICIGLPEGSLSDLDHTLFSSNDPELTFNGKPTATADRDEIVVWRWSDGKVVETRKLTEDNIQAIWGSDWDNLKLHALIQKVWGPLPSTQPDD